MADLVCREEIFPGVTRLVLNRPERRNALSIALMQQLSGSLKELEQDPAQRIALIAGNGPVFCAGLDLQEAANSELVEQSAACVADVLRRLHDTTLITIATVHGAAYAGGAGLLAACDVVVAADDALIGFPEARRGLLPALICDVLRHKVREGDLRDLLLTGEPITTTRAQQLGLVQRIAPVQDLQQVTLQVSRSILAGGPDTIRQTKLLLNNVFSQPAGHEGDALLESHLSARRSAEAHEGLTAFLEKRPPRWSPPSEHTT